MATLFERMIQLADEVFEVKHDPNQLDVNEEVIQRLFQIHPATVSEYNEGEGPAAWVLIFPTTSSLMHSFLKGSISEKELFEQTPIGASYDSVYLCSALVLEEYRRQGIVKNLSTLSIQSICKTHQIKQLFVWAFSAEGDHCATQIAKLSALPLLKRENPKH